MIIFPHAKINLGLNVVRKREDGFHDIETAMVPIPLQDILEAVKDPSLGKVKYPTHERVFPLPEPWKAICVGVPPRNFMLRE
ncbi:MAG: hypothetical protein IPI91_18185 [Flavobacteriales bacterium]|nr:hypothetical protein [Flavobacteriales bacterium]